MNGISRRFLLGGMLSGALAGGALAEAPLRSPRPVARGASSPAGPAAAPAATGPAQATARVGTPAASELIAAARLGGKVGCVVLDAQSGAVLENLGGAEPLPPASVAKAITSLYALETLGPAFRFPTRLIATGPLQGGAVKGDLILAGGGDPTLSTDMLGDMAAALRAKGVKTVEGRFLVWGGALPFLEAIDPTQPDWLGYNPAVSGLNLNFNRVYFEWKRGPKGYELGMDARGARFVPRVYTARISVAQRDLPVYTYSDRGDVEQWTVAQSALGRAGSRWLPVRRPELYAADVFQTLARAQGIVLPGPALARSAPQGTVLVEWASDDLRTVLRDMLKYSTNMTAEAVGMTASARRGGISRHAESGAAMSAWLQGKTGASARFVDHSGLGGASRIAPLDMAGALLRLGPGLGLRGLLKDVPMRDAKGKPVAGHPVQVQAKTGTLNFVSNLAGYISAPGGREMVFAIFTGDVARRDAVPDAQKERPAGGIEWVRRSKQLQQQLIERWAAVYGA